MAAPIGAGEAEAGAVFGEPGGAFHPAGAGAGLGDRRAGAQQGNCEKG
jgi:hypothetical protein